MRVTIERERKKGRRSKPMKLAEAVAFAEAFNARAKRLGLKARARIEP